MMGSGVAQQRPAGVRPVPRTGLGTEANRSRRGGGGAADPLERERTSVDVGARRPPDLANTPSGSLIGVPGVSRTVVERGLFMGCG